jgi:hypothetical protein
LCAEPPPQFLGGRLARPAAEVGCRGHDDIGDLNREPVDVFPRSVNAVVKLEHALPLAMRLLDQLDRLLDAVRGLVAGALQGAKAQAPLLAPPVEGRLRVVALLDGLGKKTALRPQFASESVTFPAQRVRPFDRLLGRGNRLCKGRAFRLRHQQREPQPHRFLLRHFRCQGLLCRVTRHVPIEDRIARGKKAQQIGGLWRNTQVRDQRLVRSRHPRSRDARGLLGKPALCLFDPDPKICDRILQAGDRRQPDAFRVAPSARSSVSPIALSKAAARPTASAYAAISAPSGSPSNLLRRISDQPWSRRTRAAATAAASGGPCGGGSPAAGATPLSREMKPAENPSVGPGLDAPSDKNGPQA